VCVAERILTVCVCVCVCVAEHVLTVCVFVCVCVAERVLTVCVCLSTFSLSAASSLSYAGDQ